MGHDMVDENQQAGEAAQPIQLNDSLARLTCLHRRRGAGPGNCNRGRRQEIFTKNPEKSRLRFKPFSPIHDHHDPLFPRDSWISGNEMAVVNLGEA